MTDSLFEWQRLALVIFVGAGIVLGSYWLFLNPRRYKASLERLSVSRAPLYSSRILRITAFILLVLLATWTVWFFL
jgi:hypothetical protein